MRLPRHIQAYGSTAVLLSWEQRISPAISAGVHSFSRATAEHPAVKECVPAYASLLVVFDASLVGQTRLMDWLYDLRPAPVDAERGLLHRIPVCYDGVDLPELAETLSISMEEIVALHTSVEYLVYQIGYLPGFAFLGQTDHRLACQRRPSPRSKIPAGSVGLAGRQTGIYPTASPGGWQLIGRTPVLMLQAGAGLCRIRAGDRVQFFAISADEFNDYLQNPLPWPER